MHAHISDEDLLLDYYGEATPEQRAVMRTHLQSCAACQTLDRELRAAKFAVAGIIANRVYDFPPLEQKSRTRIPATLREKLIANYADFAALGARDRAALEILETKASAPLLAVVPVLEEPPASVAGLRRVADRLRA